MHYLRRHHAGRGILGLEHRLYDALLLALSGTCWIAAFGMFEIVYGPMLLTRRPANT